MRLLVLSLLLSAGLHADFDPKGWHFKRAIQFEPPREVSTFRIDPLLYRALSPSQSDIRVLRDGVETPYIITTLAGSVRETELHPATLNQGVLPGTGVQITLELEQSGRHNRLRLTTPERNFRQRVRVETGEDPLHWSIARDDGYIFDFSQGDRHVSVLSVDYPVATRRYVRVTVFGWSDTHAISSAWLTFHEEQPAVRDAMATIRPAITADAKAHATILTADAGFPGLPHNEVRFTVGPSYFYRAVEIETCQNRQDWTYVGPGVLSRTPEREELVVNFPEQWDRYTRVKIYNGDDPPLAVESLELAAFERVVTFPSSAAGHYVVYYGSPGAKSPSYDFGKIFTGSTAVTSQLGAEQVNPEYRAPPPPRKPWTEEHPELLYTLLGTAVVAMGYVTIRFLMKFRLPPST